MFIFNKKSDLTAHLAAIRTQKTKIGFVPTMGALHQGHLSLLKESIKNNAITVVSIFVNPTQFNNAEDLTNYPRTLERDVEKIKTVSKDIIVYAPSVEDIYEGNTKSTAFDYDGLEFQMEGAHRPGHFDGVGTIVKKLFEIVQPTNAYFGEKDFQQLQIVKKMVQKHNLTVTIHGCPIHREANGLAMSSRNERLSADARNEAALIYKTLKEAKSKFENHSAKEVIAFVENTFKKHPNFQLEYFEIADEATLLSCIRKSKSKKYRGFIAIFINNIRLIDNISLN
ncbi:putative pantoate--beta-alanine ligase [Flavobacterium cauense R2A-7]|uniref:Pantothenate synthetase n=1 Tax=Flavobacterium cauense R2A-7 TaxID=1341154 RepID=V6RZ07_9FLAO|nr:pantoate--beta-alanine ligase [Flavobacterium cauense]ESU19409.1 putative pantoate--beta-alanine ligase [Flavobacterium cauense R2A-7]KGO80371.1 pantothenate synthetase [Flavobacterium cauense R2A-7]TWI08286.1 pantoate--beta-alanine ligase [Flavobacterium cauense R2A-7]